MDQAHLRNMMQFAAESIPAVPQTANGGQRHLNKCKKCQTIGSIHTYPEMEIHIQKDRGITVTTMLPSWKECRFCHAQDSI